MRTIILTSAALLVVTGCTSERVVNTGDWEAATTPPTSASPPLPPMSRAHTAEALDFFANPGGRVAYYFSTPSGRWQCGVLPRDKAGCQATAGALGIAGAPETVRDAAGEQVPPNAIVIEPEGAAHFAALDTAQFAPPRPADVLPFNQTLAVARFRCNIQETKGVACLSEESGKGFTFSADGFNLQYSEVPLDTP
jgi:hypothetical protein